MAKGNKSKKQILAVVQAPNMSQQPSGKTARNRRRRQKRRNNRGAIAKLAGSSVKQMKRWPGSRDGATFLRAALDPFSDVTLRSVGVPDIFAGETLKHQNTMEISVTPDGNGNISLVILPSPSDPILMIQGNFQNVLIPTADPTTFQPNGTTRVTIGAAAVPGFYGTIAWPAWADYNGTTGGPGLYGGYGPYGYKSQRVISMGLEWRYTGTELSDQGVATAAIVDAYLIPGYTDYMTANNAAASIGFVQRGDISTLTNVTQDILANQPQYRQQTMHSAEGAGGMLVLISAEEGYCLKATNNALGLLDATYHTAQFLAGGGANNCVASYGLTTGATPSGTAFPILPFQNLRPVGLTFTGLAANQPIVLKLKQRIEATVNPASAFAQFTDASPQEDMASLEMVADIQKTLPVMVPVTMNGFGDWWRKIMGVIGNVGRIVGGMGVPFVSPIAAGVGGLADVFGAL